MKWLNELLDLPKATTETITVAKPCCTPARGIIEQIFNKYGVKLIGYEEKYKYRGYLPSLIEAQVKVSAKQAVWAEYLLLRSHQFMLFSKPKHPRNFEWAKKHNVMPESWNGKPLIEKNCKDGLEKLKNVKNVGNKRNKKR